MARSSIFIGCAGWSVPAPHAALFPVEGSHLERYAARFGAVEINSSFYRPHRPQTYQKWAALVPEHFRFAVKMPRVITHEKRLKNVEEPLERFLMEAGALGDKLGPLLVQLPPSFAFDESVAREFFGDLREKFAGQVVCEPRHFSWFAASPNQLLGDFGVARVAADPAGVPAAGEPGGWGGLAYFRLHGSPQVYYSAYTPQFLDDLAVRLDELAARETPAWCIFDNTAAFAATENALAVLEKIKTLR